MNLYHQLGHSKNWNINAYREDEAGDGFILSPSFIMKKTMTDLPSIVLQHSIFDPQFFLPSIAHKHLATYEFHPDVIMNGFKTSEFSDTHAKDSARGCVQFQIDLGTRSIVIPSRLVEGMPTDFTNQLDDLFVQPYLEVCREIKHERGILLQLLLNSGMLKDDRFRSDLLNWITGLTEVDGVYCIFEKRDRSNQIADADMLYGALRFIDALRRNQMEVVIGYCNTEAILYSVADPSAVTMGNFNTNRIFRESSFRPRDGDAGPGPARIFSERLLQWIDFNFIGAIERSSGIERHIYFDDSDYLNELMDPTFKPHPNKEIIYRHYYQVFTRLCDVISEHTGAERWEHVQDRIETAYQEFDGLGILFDSEGDGSHLPHWHTAVHQFASYKGWK